MLNRLAGMETTEELILQSWVLKAVWGLFLSPSTDQMRPTHIMQDNLLFSKSVGLDVNYI